MAIFLNYTISSYVKRNVFRQAQRDMQTESQNTSIRKYIIICQFEPVENLFTKQFQFRESEAKCISTGST
jgi:hypothetical protein